MAHVDLAVTEMFRAVHMQMLGNACRLEKILLAALVIETRATGTPHFLSPRRSGLGSPWVGPLAPVRLRHRHVVPLPEPYCILPIITWHIGVATGLH